MKNVYREIKILTKLDHPNIIKLLHTIDAQNQIILVMEYVGQKTLHSYLKDKPDRKISEDKARIIFK